MDSFSSFSAPSGPFNQCKLSPFILPYSKSNESSRSVVENAEADKQQMLTCGQVVLIGLEVRPPDDWAGTAADFCKLFEKFLPCIVFAYNLLYRDNIIQSQACNPRTTVKVDGLFWYDLVNINRIAMQAQPYGLRIFTTTKIDVRSAYVSKDLVLSICVSAVYESAKASNSSSSLTAKTKSASHMAKVDAEEREVRLLMERQRFSPPKPPTHELKIKVKVISPVAIVCRNYEMGLFSTLVTISIENHNLNRPISVKEVALRLGMTTAEAYRESGDSACNSDNDDDTNSFDYIEQFSKIDLARVISHLSVRPIVALSEGAAESTRAIFPVTIKASESYSFAYEATIASSSSSNCIAAEKEVLLGLLRGAVMCTPCAVRWEDEKAVSEMHFEHDVKWSIGSKYHHHSAAAGSRKQVIAPFDLQVSIKRVHATNKVLVNAPLALLIVIENKSENVFKRSSVQVMASAQEEEVAAISSFIITKNGVMKKDLGPRSRGETISLTIVPIVSGTLVIEGLCFEGIDSGERRYFHHVFAIHVHSS